MPRTVDHEKRRKEVIDIASKLVSERGLHEVSLRDIAREAGSSTMIVSHYFKGKSEMMLHVMRQSLEAHLDRRRSLILAHPDDLLSVIQFLLPYDQARIQKWKIWMAFLSMSTTDERFAEEWSSYHHGFVNDLHEILQVMVANGIYPAKLDCIAAGERLVCFIVGLATQMIVVKDDWSVAKVEKIISEELAGLATSAANVS